MTKLRFFLILLLSCVSVIAQSAQSKQLNIYAWGGELPQSLIKKFEKETNIKVNFSTYDSNEVMLAKLKTSNSYDIIMPSNYVIEKLEGKLQQIEKSRLSNLKYLSPAFNKDSMKKANQWAVPITFSVTGIFYNKNYHKNILHWDQLWQKQLYHKLLLLDDMREVFSMAFFALNKSANPSTELEVKSAYTLLLKLKNNIKLLATNTVQGLIIDEDITIGMAWNSDAYKASTENENIRFHLPQEGFAMSIDYLAILKSSTNKDNAYQFINFLLAPQNAKQIMLQTGMSSTNQAAYSLLPKQARENLILNIPDKTLENATLIKKLPISITKVINHYWQLFKLSF